MTFFLAGEEDLTALARLDPEREWRQFVRGERAWVLQTYLRLQRAGYPAELAETLPRRGLVVFHAKQRRAVQRQLRRLSGGSGPVLVGVRADNREPLLADFEVLQNGRWADGRRRFALPHWPQAGLIPRGPERGDTVARVGYKGFAANLHAELRSPEWLAFLEQGGLEWVTDAVEFAGRATDEAALAWNDYSRLDLVVAMRPPSRRLHTAKPATKLFNAWLAGVPALLGPEHACREVRTSPLDYLEVASRREAEAAVERLRQDQGLYRAMVEHGRRRGEAFRFEATTERWAELLFRELPARAASRSHRAMHRLPPGLRVALRRLGRLLALRPAR